MNIAVVGLGRMGNAIAFRANSAGHTVIGYDADADACARAKEMGIEIAANLQELASKARIFWLMVPIDAVGETVKILQQYCKAGDIIIDGGNSLYTDSIERAHALEMDNIHFLDCGTSGGVQGRAIGFCLMVGGDHDAYTKVHSVLTAIAAPGAVAHIGPSGTGHYVKMVHNGIEYGLLQAYAEGFQIIKEGTFKDQGIDLEQLSGIWNISSVIRSWLLTLTHEVMQEDQNFTDVSGKLAEGGTGRWTVEEAERNKIRVPVIEAALEQRTWSRKTGGDYATKLVALLRNKFGGHYVKRGN